MTAVVNKRKCPAQKKLCQAIPACPNGAIHYQEDENAPLGGVILIDADKCSDCGACVEACCGSAIQIT
jgi:ferredoxin